MSVTFVPLPLRHPVSTPRLRHRRAPGPARYKLRRRSARPAAESISDEEIDEALDILSEKWGIPL